MQNDMSPEPPKKKLRITDDDPESEEEENEVDVKQGEFLFDIMCFFCERGEEGLMI